MKKNKVCPKCDSMKIGYFEKTVAPAYVGRVPTDEVFAPRAFDLVGKLEAYLCAECGYFENYVADPQALPFDKLEGFRWIHPERPEEKGPYR